MGRFGAWDRLHNPVITDTPDWGQDNPPVGTDTTGFDRSGPIRSMVSSGGGGAGSLWGGGGGGSWSGRRVPAPANPDHTTNTGTGSSTPSSGGGSMTSSFDEGGVVPETDETDGTGEQGAQAGQVNPVDYIQGVVRYGRGALGLPTDFSGGQEQQSFDDGGEVEGQADEQAGGVIPGDQQVDAPNSGATAGAQQPPVSPKKVLTYLAGDKALPPDIFAALEKRVDPDGSKSTAERTMGAIAAAGRTGQASAFAAMQSARVRYNGFSGAARAAIDQGDTAKAAHYATEALGHIPTGQDVRVAPARGGFAISARGVGGQQGFDDGGAVDALNPDNDYDENGNSKEQGFDDGGDVEPQEEDGVIPAQDEAAPVAEETPQDATAAPEPMDEQAPEQAQGPDEMEGTPAPAKLPGPEQSPFPAKQPEIISPQQLKDVLAAGYDKPLDMGWQRFVARALNRTPDTAPPVRTGDMGIPKTSDKDQSRKTEPNPGAERLQKMKQLQDEAGQIYGRGRFADTPAGRQMQRDREGYVRHGMELYTAEQVGDKQQRVNKELARDQRGITQEQKETETARKERNNERTNITKERNSYRNANKMKDSAAVEAEINKRFPMPESGGKPAQAAPQNVGAGSRPPLGAVNMLRSAAQNPGTKQRAVADFEKVWPGWAKKILGE